MLESGVDVSPFVFEVVGEKIFGITTLFDSTSIFSKLVTLKLFVFKVQERLIPCVFWVI
jgi:hypothetical protein